MTFHILSGIVFTDLEICSFRVAIHVTLRLLINECQTVTCIPVSVKKCERWWLHEAQPFQVRLELGGPCPASTPTAWLSFPYLLGPVRRCRGRRGAAITTLSRADLVRTASRLCSWITPALGRAGQAGLGAGEPLGGPELQPLGRTVNSPPNPGRCPSPLGSDASKHPGPERPLSPRPALPKACQPSSSAASR